MSILPDQIVPQCLQSKPGSPRPAVRAWVRRRLIPAALAAGCIFWIAAQSSPTEAERKEEAIWQHRNLGKAFFENPTTQLLAVDEFKAALDLAPDSPRERLNYGLALLKAGRMAEGVAELEKAQQQAPDL